MGTAELKSARTQLAETLVRITNGEHTAIVARLKPGVVLVTEQGLQTADARALILREIEAELARASPAAVFIDIRKGQRLDAAGRDEWAAFGKRERERLRRVVVLVNSSILEMAFSLMALALGGGLVRVLSKEADMVAEIRGEVPTFRGLASVGLSATAP